MGQDLPKRKFQSISILTGTQLCTNILRKWGFSNLESKWITKNLIAAEMACKQTHGLSRLQFIDKYLLKNVNIKGKSSIISESQTHIYVDANSKLGFEPIYESLYKGFEKLKVSNVVTIGVKNSLFAGYVGDYAYETVKNGYIYIGFHNSTPALIPFGTIDPLWGTNPITVGIPGGEHPVIYDAAMSQISGGQVLISKKTNKKLPNNVALDESGNITRDPNKSAGLLPLGYKGSGLAYIVELLAGALTGSKVGGETMGGWGSFSIIINPTAYIPLEQLINSVNKSQIELKKSRKAKGVSEVLFPGERSTALFKQSQKNQQIEMPLEIYNEIIKLGGKLDEESYTI